MTLWMKCSLLLICALGMVSAGDIESREVPLFVFATIADSHIRLGEPWDDRGFIKATGISSELLANYVQDINSYDPPVDFVVHLGDITDYGRPSEFAAARAILDSLHCPLYTVIGNHEVFDGESKDGWRLFAGMDSTNYTFDYEGFHFIVVDCTPEHYDSQPIKCGRRARDWVAADLSSNPTKPAFLLSHYNMWERDWGATFDGRRRYEEYEGMPELRAVLEESGNVVAVINGHVHANRVEVHNGIHYVDIGATIVGKPSIRYFHVFAESVQVRSEYISDRDLLTRVSKLASLARAYPCSPKSVSFIDGKISDREFTIPVRIPVRDSDLTP
jgi:alkaline phosphatase